MRYHAWWGTWLGEKVSDGTLIIVVVVIVVVLLLLRLL
jgi:hypothetical protein